MKLEISDVAFTKLLLHAWKYPQNPVNGYLIGKVNTTKAADSDGSSLTVGEGANSSITVSDAIPLFHSHTLATSLEVATELIDCGENEIVGYYYANERVDEASIPIVAERIANQLIKDVPGAALVQINNQRLQDPDDHALEALGYTKNGWKAQLAISSAHGGESLKSALELAENAITYEMYDNLADFDEHFEDVSRDPHNTQLTADLSRLSQRNA